MRFLSPAVIRPSGWLLRQLQIQASGLAGNLDRIWPDVRDSRWIGGDREGWERVPYWLDGFIPLAWMLDDEDLKHRATRYINAIIDRQEPDGWICPCSRSERPKYDTWAVLLIGKVLISYYDCTGDRRALTAVRGAFRQLNQHLEQYPLFNWGRFRWFEGLVTLTALKQIDPEPWLDELARKLHRQGVDYSRLIAENRERLTQPSKKWDRDNHVVNYAMALKAAILYGQFTGNSEICASEELFQFLRHFHGTSYGHFTGDECLAGCSPIQGSELCSVVEAMYSFELNFAAGGDMRWLDRLERLAFNGLPAATTADMWAHQYVQQSNQIGAVTESALNWTTNNGQAHIFGLEPHFGCCTANFGQGWPKLALSSLLRSDSGVVAAVHLPVTADLEINGVEVRIECRTDYPFRSRINYVITSDRPVEFEFGIAIPGFADLARVDGREVECGGIYRIFKVWRECEEIQVDLEFSPRPSLSRNGLYSIWRGPLLFALPVTGVTERREYVSDGVERRYPYCDYEIAPAGEWRFGLAGLEFESHEHPVPEMPFAPDNPPVTLSGRLVPVEWKIKPGFRAICNPLPESNVPAGNPVAMELIPYGCTMLRMTELPLVGKNTDEP